MFRSFSQRAPIDSNRPKTTNTSTASSSDESMSHATLRLDNWVTFLAEIVFTPGLLVALVAITRGYLLANRPFVPAHLGLRLALTLVLFIVVLPRV